jgi:hypothetical protein
LFGESPRGFHAAQLLDRYSRPFIVKAADYFIEAFVLSPYHFEPCLTASDLEFDLGSRLNAERFPHGYWDDNLPFFRNDRCHTMLPLSKSPTAQFITASFTGKTYSEELLLKRYAPEAGNYGRALGASIGWMEGSADPGQGSPAARIWQPWQFTPLRTQYAETRF